MENNEYRPENDTNEQAKEERSEKSGFNSNPYGDPGAVPPPIDPQNLRPTTPSSFGLISMILGIIGLVMCCCYGSGFLFSVASLVLAIVEVAREKKFSGFGIAGLILGIVGIVLALIVWVFVIIALLVVESESGSPGTAAIALLHLSAI